MALLDRPEAQELLDDANVSPQAVRGCADRLTRYLARFLPLFGRKELREQARLAVEGRLSGLQRKTSEPIAREADKPRRGLQRFVGAGESDDETVMGELRVQVREVLAAPNAVLVLDPSCLPKKGTESCGGPAAVVRSAGQDRQLPGRCLPDVFLAYAAAQGHAPLDRRLYLPESWAVDKQRRKKCHVPTQVKYQPKWQIDRELIEQSRDLPHAWIVGDDEFGRVTEFR